MLAEYFSRSGGFVLAEYFARSGGFMLAEYFARWRRRCASRVVCQIGGALC